MRLFFAFLLVGLGDAAIDAKSRKTCPLTESDFLGSWSTRPVDTGVVKNDTHEIAFEIDTGRHIYNSWLHHRPEYFDRPWLLSDCRVVVTEDGYTLEYGFLKHDRKRLVQLPYKYGDHVYRKTR